MKKVMKRTFLIVLGCLLCGIMKAQQQQRLFEEFLREAGDHAEMFQGKIEYGYPPNIYLNLPYWTFDDFVQGDVPGGTGTGGAADPQARAGGCRQQRRPQGYEH